MRPRATTLLAALLFGACHHPRVSRAGAVSPAMGCVTAGNLRSGRARVYDARSVTRAVQPPKENIALRSTPFPGTVVAEFVVDSTGRADLATVNVVSPASPKQLESVREYLTEAHFQAAEVNGRRVLQCVQQRFEFVLPR
ncbi:MAG: energy transducer TonB [Gemmatimonadota bacterium]|nr:energy transducer TonB [Gemmatimonadota bacterium]